VDAGIYEFVAVGSGPGAGSTPPAAAPASGTVNRTPSSGCARAAPDAIEEIICADPMLAALDGELARLLRLATAAKVNTAASVRSDQRAWLKQRHACARVPAAAACLRERYLQRIVDLRTGRGAARGEDGHGISSGPFAFACEGIEGPVSVSFVRTDPPLAHIQDKTGTWLMEQRPSGSGARYEGARASEMFWNKGDEALFQRGEGTPETKCQRQVVR
jgi:membrane-bound inhibitor of C-type lysozyme